MKSYLIYLINGLKLRFPSAFDVAEEGLPGVIIALALLSILGRLMHFSSLANTAFFFMLIFFLVWLLRWLEVGND